MMSTIMEIVRRHHAFAGRKRELTLMRQMLIEDKPWRMVHVYGAAGMGKTALLHHFAEEIKDFPVLYLDAPGGKNGFASPRHFLEELDRVLSRVMTDGERRLPIPSEPAARLNRLAKRHGRVLLMLDGLGSDEWQAVDEWLQSTFLPALAANVRICSAGRTPLHHWIAKPGWNRLITWIRLEPLKRAEWLRYLELCGIRDKAAQERIGRLCGGVPLLLCLAANQEMQPSPNSPPGEGKSEARDLLAATAFAALNLKEEERLLLGLASILHTFDQELLAAMLGRPLSDELFQRFCALPAIRARSGGGWSVVEGFRQLVRSEMRNRMPETYRKYKQRAASALDRRMADERQQRPLAEAAAHSHHSEQTPGYRLKISKLVLEDHDFVQHILYYGDDAGFAVRPALREELPLLMKICESNIRDTPPYKPDLSRQQAYLPQLWHISPESVLTLTDGGRIAGFIAPVRLTPAVIELFRNNPATEKLMRHPFITECEYFFWIMGVDPPMDPRSLGFALRNVFLPRLCKARRSAIMVWHPEAAASIPLLGCRPLQEADYEAANGLSFRFFRYDAEQDGAAAQRDDLSPERMAAVKQLLEQMREPGQQEARQRLMAEHVRLAAGTETERMLARILELAYMKKRISHELVAARLNLSSATYYRYLRKLIRHLAERLPFPS